jgi:hypothetical protein
MRMQATLMLRQAQHRFAHISGFIIGFPVFVNGTLKNLVFLFCLYDDAM